MIRLSDRPVLSLLLALGFSAGLHALAVWSFGQLSFELALDFELGLPAEIELGVTEELEAAPPEPSAPEAEPVTPERSQARAAQRQETEQAVEAHEPESDAPEEPAPGTLDGPSRLPAGAQLAVRLDMRRIGGSPLAPAVREFLRQIPDWHFLLSGSDIDALSDLDRLFIATPDPRRRSRLIIAGRAVDGEPRIRDAVSRMAEARGEAADWRNAQGVRVADWHNLDATARILALLGPSHFAIAREEDLAIVRAMAEHRARRGATEGLESGEGAEALLSMGPEDALTFEVEGIHRYVRGGRTDFVPVRGRLAVRETEGGQLEVEGLAFFDTEEEAQAALAHWEERRVRTLREYGIILSALGLRSVLSEGALELVSDRVRIRTRVTHGQARQVLAFIGAEIAAITRWQPPPAPSDGAAPPSDDTSDSPSEPVDARSADEPPPQPSLPASPRAPSSPRPSCDTPASDRFEPPPEL